MSTSTSHYRYDEARGWVTGDGDGICAVIYEPRDFDCPEIGETLEDFLCWEEGDIELPPQDERRAFIGECLIEAERNFPDLVYELIRDTIRDTINDALRVRAEAAKTKAEVPS